ncbi:hypothetical protein K443DRAFT_762 [Laccaria amethystina LaAM-08-1]|uniref:Uncharacterized protein n=1 Tax=Laccaria amethystina LaAM-08-1 TaxID=1095629 RepID=A0A0C9XXE6_9AGAR|nr:hypothetical protein K443DRAFT_762 [Laccaria amethystina LaAM-08-1]
MAFASGKMHSPTVMFPTGHGIDEIVIAAEVPSTWDTQICDINAIYFELPG